MTLWPFLGRFPFLTVGGTFSSLSSSVSAGLVLTRALGRGSLIAPGALAAFFFGGIKGAASASSWTASDAGLPLVRGWGFAGAEAGAGKGFGWLTLRAAVLTEGDPSSAGMGITEMAAHLGHFNFFPAKAVLPTFNVTPQPEQGNLISAITAPTSVVHLQDFDTMTLVRSFFSAASAHRGGF
jgi:hypothetical protein